MLSRGINQRVLLHTWFKRSSYQRQNFLSLHPRTPVTGLPRQTLLCVRNGSVVDWLSGQESKTIWPRCPPRLLSCPASCQSTGFLTSGFHRWALRLCCYAQYCTPYSNMCPSAILLLFVLSLFSIRARTTNRGGSEQGPKNSVANVKLGSAVYCLSASPLSSLLYCTYLLGKESFENSQVIHSKLLLWAIDDNSKRGGFGYANS